VKSEESKNKKDINRRVIDADDAWMPSDPGPDLV
jgi:hypothetical protein